MKVLISGGGTGGHVFPAIAIADALKVEDSNIEILFVGANGKLEMTKVPAAGYKIEGLNIAGFHRKLTLKNLKFPIKLISSMWKAYAIVKKFKPDAAIGVGGYASGPTLKAASWLNVPTFIQEQNSYAGVTNKLLAKKAKRIFVAYEGMDKFFDANKITLSGNPVRTDILTIDLNSLEARQKIDVPLGMSKVVLISGGSLGARAINEAILEMEDYVACNSDVFFYWQVGKLYLDEFSNKSIAKLSNVKIVAFIDDMGAAYKAADVVICRAGALTISELTIVGKPVILMPSPNVAEDHQTHNALALVKKSAAILVKDKEANEKLEKELNKLLQDENRRKELIKNIEALGKKDAATIIAKDIKEYLETKKY